MNRLNRLFERKQSQILNIYFTAGYPQLHDTVAIVKALEAAGADMIEIGMPYSDPLADGPTIQESEKIALDNGMTLRILFDQIEEIRKTSDIPLILMGYFNQVIQYGDKAFFERCKATGIDGLILPDMPLEIFEKDYQGLFISLGLNISFLITPQTETARIRKIDQLSTGFVYMVSSYALTGAKEGISEAQLSYFKRIEKMELKNPRLIGFGISDKKTFDIACTYSNGAIIGSAFIKALNAAAPEALSGIVEEFIQHIRGLSVATI